MFPNQLHLHLGTDIGEMIGHVGVGDALVQVVTEAAWCGITNNLWKEKKLKHENTYSSFQQRQIGIISYLKKRPEQMFPCFSENQSHSQLLL